MSACSETARSDEIASSVGVGRQGHADHASTASSVCLLATHGLMVRRRILDCKRFLDTVARRTYHESYQVRRGSSVGRAQR